MNNQHKTYSKAIKTLRSNAAKGNLLSMFQLYENYNSGKNVEAVNEELAQDYLNLISDHLPNAKFKLKSVNLYNFRRLKSFELTINDKLTIIIGNNGAGKTAIVEALAKSFSWFNNALMNIDSGRPVTEADVNVNAKDYGEVVTSVELGEHTPIETALIKVAPKNLNSQSSKVSDIKLAGSLYRHLAANEKVMIPLLAYYSVERSNFTVQQEYLERATGNISTNRYDSLDNALEGSGKLDKFSELYIELVNLAQGEAASEVQLLRKKVSNIESILDEAYEGQKPSENDPVVKRLAIEKKELENALRNNCSAKYQKQLDLVNNAIEDIVPEVTHFGVDRASGKVKIMVNNFGNRVNISQLSQGQKTLVVLTGDLARRLVTLNPNAENPLNAHGVVIIDEVELHLHPQWQQEILIGLQTTFPNLQFIVTTHSPQVLSTVDNKCIRQICLDGEGRSTISTPTFQTKGVTSADILARIMGTNSVPEKLEEAGWLNDFSRHLKEGNKEKLDSIFTKIKIHFGDHHPVVVDCESQIRIAEMKARLNKEQ